MKFVEVYAENFCTLEKVTLPLANQGMILITGENRDAAKADSNGAGKSLLLDALCWGLWGKTTRGQEGDAVVNRFKKKDCYVRVVFEDDSKTYVVERFRKHSKHSKSNDLTLTVNGVPDSTGHMTKTQERVTRILGLDFPTFQIMMPGAGIKAADLTDAKIKECLEKILQTEALGDAQELAKAKAKELETAIKKDEHSLSVLVTNLETMYGFVKSYEEQNKTFEEEQEREYDTLVDSYNTAASNRDKVGKAIEAEATIKEKLEEKNVAHLIVMGKINNITDALKEQNNKRVRLVSEMNAQVSIHASKKKNVQETLDYLKEHSTCTACAQAISQKHVDTQTDLLLDKIRIIDTDIQTVSDSFNEKIGLVDSVISEYNDKLDKAHEEQAAMEESVQKLLALMSNINAAKYRYSIMCEETKKLEDKVSTYKKKENNFKELITGIQTKIDTDEAAKTALEVALSKNKAELELYNFWVNGFSIKGIRSYMLKHVTPILNDRAKYYADLLTGGDTKVKFHTERILSKGEKKEEFWIEVTQTHGSESYEGSSKGEQSRADLIIAMTLGDLAALRAHKTIPFRFLDEPFENVDASGTDAIVNLLNSQKEKYDTVFVITHNDSFKQMFNKTINVVKQNEQSTLEIL